MTTEFDTMVPAEAPLKARLVLMGEFSSGKSTLSNILLGGPTLPTQVTATRLPPVHISYGEPSAYAIARDGTRIEVDLADLAALTPETVRSLHLTMISDTLELCDLVDMPGISDPNMPTDTWDQSVRSTDHVIWCTHATQAWRQSEAAMWDRMRDATGGTNLLLITQFDKLRNPRDRSRVLSRVASETAGKFSATYPVALLDALEAGDDLDAWKESGAHAFMEHLVEILLVPPVATVPASVKEDATETPVPLQATSAASAENVIEIPRSSAARSAGDEASSNADQTATHAASRVMPRRVQAKAENSDAPRPQRPSTADGWLGALEPGVI